MDWKNNNELITLRKCDISSSLRMAFPYDEEMIGLIIHSFRLFEVKQ